MRLFVFIILICFSTSTFAQSDTAYYQKFKQEMKVDTLSDDQKQIVKLKQDNQYLIKQRDIANDAHALKWTVLILIIVALFASKS